MPNSYAQPTPLTCPSCGRDFTADLWLIVDEAERPDLIQRLVAGRLHDLPCPHCKQAGFVDAPLLVYRPGQDPILTFSPAQRATDEQSRDHAGSLLGLLSENLGPLWHESWLEQVAVLGRGELAGFIAGAAAPGLAAAAALQQLRARDPDAYDQLQTAVRQVTAEAIRSDPFLAAVEALSQAETMADFLRVARDHSLLLEAEGRSRVADGVAHARQQGAQALAAVLQDRYDHLRELVQIVAESEYDLTEAIAMAESY